MTMELEELLGAVQKRFRPYDGQLPAFSALPAKGVARTELLDLLAKMEHGEEGPWKKGRVSGAVYHGEREHAKFATRAYALSSHTNPLHPDVWPSLVKMESEIVAMTAHMLGGGASTRGAVTSGGTESILIAMKAYRDWSRAKRSITEPEVVLPVSAHVAFDKACHYFGLRPKLVPLTEDYAANVEAVKTAITPNTAVVVGSAPCFPYGVVDPIREMSEVAKDAGVGFHTDACLGGFILPWAKRLGEDVPTFDLGLPGVTSISADTHKYGYAPKGTSVVLYSDPEILHRQYYVAKHWPGGIYFSTTMAGSRPGGLVAAAWATLLALGEEGYLELAKKVLAAAKELRSGVAKVPGVHLMGQSPIVAAFRTEPQDVYQVMELLSQRGWFLNGLQNPPGLHLAVTLRQTPPAVVRSFLRDLRWAMKEAATGSGTGGLAPVYGLASTMPDDAVEEFLDSILDWMYHGS
ncbi:MAG: aspartate aminotransferase family protein [Euryarchaeota archaeon]|nr:aspartate aminotransferase family protein [Euryarchaeota archaeon]